MSDSEVVAIFRQAVIEAKAEFDEALKVSARDLERVRRAAAAWALAYESLVVELTARATIKAKRSKRVIRGGR